MANVCFPSFGISRVGRKWLSIFEIWRNRDCSQSKRRQLKQRAWLFISPILAVCKTIVTYGPLKPHGHFLQQVLRSLGGRKLNNKESSVHFFSFRDKG